MQWNIADFLYQNRTRILENLTPDISVFPDFPGVSEIPQFDRLWLGIYQRLGELCIDERPAVRKSAGQTLFSTISAHSAILNCFSWDSVMWQVNKKNRQCKIVTYCFIFSHGNTYMLRICI